MSTSNYQNNLPEYTLRRSSRAKNLRLEITPAKGLQIVVPAKYDLSKIFDFLHQHRRWIDKHLSTLPRKQHLQVPPEILNLFAVDETWKVDYIPVAGKNVVIRKFFKGKLVIIGNIKNKKLVRRELLKWLKIRAQENFLPWIDKISARTGLIYKDAIIRYTKTRWASCTAKKRISLSPSLLFISPELVEHIILHELCHTVHLDHSVRFWRFFKKYDPRCDILRKKLSEAHRLLPYWLESEK